MGRTHELKIWPEPFEAVTLGDKRYEIRKDDRGYAVGDYLVLKEYDPSPDTSVQTRPRGFTGRECRVVLRYITPAGAWGLPPNLCVMSIEVIYGKT